jgi:hypothetical protein
MALNMSIIRYYILEDLNLKDKRLKIKEQR